MLLVGILVILKANAVGGVNGEVQLEIFGEPQEMMHFEVVFSKLDSVLDF